MITGKTLRIVRDSASMTQREVASRLNVSLRSVGNWERTDNVPRKYWEKLKEIFPLIEVIAASLSSNDVATQEILRSLQSTEADRASNRAEAEMRVAQDWLRTGRRPTPDLSEDAGDEDLAPISRLYALRDELDLILRDLELDPVATRAYPAAQRESREMQLISELRAKASGTVQPNQPTPLHPSEPIDPSLLSEYAAENLRRAKLQTKEDRSSVNSNVEQ